MRSSIILFFVGLLCVSNVGGANILKKDQLVQNCEYYINKDRLLVINVAYFIGSMPLDISYKIELTKGDKGNNYYILFPAQYAFSGREIKSKRKELSIYTWGYQLKLVQADFNEQTDKLYFRDSKGDYEIKMGSEETWNLYLKESGFDSENPVEPDQLQPVQIEYPLK